MRFSMVLGLSLALAGCNNTWGVNNPGDSSDSSDSGDSGDTGVADTNGTDSGDTQASESCHIADPIDQTGWTRTYQVNWAGKDGTEVQSGLGADYTSTGQPAFVVKSELTAGSDNLTTYDYKGCNNAGGAVWYESRVEGTAALDLFDMFGTDLGGLGDIAEFLALLSSLFGDTGGSTSGASTDLPVNFRKVPTPLVPYLSDAATLQAGALISYSFDLMTLGQTAELMNIPNCTSPGATQADATCVGIQGSLQFLGLTSVTTTAGTFQAYRVVDTRTEKWSEANSAGGLPNLGDLFPMPGFGQSEDLDLISDLYYVPGIGLVKEQTRYAEAAPTDWLVERTLTNFTGLSASN